MKIHYGIAPRHSAGKRAWFYWLPHMFWHRPAIFSRYEFNFYWLCFYFFVDGEGDGLL